MSTFDPMRERYEAMVRLEEREGDTGEPLTVISAAAGAYSVYLDQRSASLEELRRIIRSGGEMLHYNPKVVRVLLVSNGPCVARIRLFRTVDPMLSAEFGERYTLVCGCLPCADGSSELLHTGETEGRKWRSMEFDIVIVVESHGRCRESARIGALLRARAGRAQRQPDKTEQ